VWSPRCPIGPATRSWLCPLPTEDSHNAVSDGGPPNLSREMRGRPPAFTYLRDPKSGTIPPRLRGVPDIRACHGKSRCNVPIRRIEQLRGEDAPDSAQDSHVDGEEPGAGRSQGHRVGVVGNHLVGSAPETKVRSRSDLGTWVYLARIGVQSITGPRSDGSTMTRTSGIDVPGITRYTR
jgi:hypothetical protein